MKCIKQMFSRNTEKIKIMLISDLHIGSKKCNKKSVDELIQTIKDEPNTYALVLGDLINNSTKSSVGDCYEEALTPQQQLDSVYQILEPIKSKILAGVSGNHCNRTLKQDGIDILYNVFARLGIESKYDNIGVVLFIWMGELVNGRKDLNNFYRQIPYTIYLSHGSGGGSTIGGKANKLKKRGEIINTDIVVAGHTHQAIIFPTARYEVDSRNCSINRKLQYFVNADALLDYEAYAEQYGLPPGAQINPEISLSGTKKEIRITL